jgi:hypothetical protein
VRLQERAQRHAARMQTVQRRINVQHLTAMKEDHAHINPRVFYQHATNVTRHNAMRSQGCMNLFMQDVEIPISV